METGSQGLGFHGKLPARGDFVRRRVSGDFLQNWDPWLERCIHQSRQQLGEAWLDAYLTSPIWRFALIAGVCGDLPCTGVLMPSVDAVGRYYPLTLVRTLPRDSALLSLATEEHAWFEALERLALSALEGEEDFDLEGFDQSVQDLGRRLAPRVAEAHSRLLEPPRGPARFRLPSLQELPSALLAMQQALLVREGGFSLWWTEGSERIAPCLFVHPGLPDVEHFAAMIDGEWHRHGWESRTVRWQDVAPGTAAPPPVATPAPPRLRSAGVSHVGKVRQVNEDAWLDRPDLGLWVVADGVGGHAAGDVASRSVVDSLQSAGSGGDLQQRLNSAREMLEVANRHLAVAAARPDRPVKSASTVVALLTGIGECCWLWAGDSRLYRLRDGMLEACTRDHSVVQELLDEGQLDPTAARDHPQANVITRAIGAADTVVVESRYSDLRPGDRFLLCSDGVHGSVEESMIASALSGDSPQSAADSLLAAVLSGEARDNCTAVVVFCD